MKELFAHAIGNSHALYFGSYFPNFRCYNVGAILAYSLGGKHKGKNHIFNILKQIGTNETLLFAFGEIDCRAHLLKQAKKQNAPIENVVDDCVKSYMRFVKQVIELGYNDIIIWGVPASSPDSLPPDRKYPRIGSSDERNKITELFNAGLKEKCEKLKINFISIFPELVDDNFEQIQKYYVDQIHLGGKSAKITVKAFKEHGIKITNKGVKRPEVIKDFYSKERDLKLIAKDLKDRNIPFEQALAEVNFYQWRFGVLGKKLKDADLRRLDLVKIELTALYKGDSDG
ncbi:MAG: hypothetical protein KAS32_08460 [Candidatus Peribacteraceae bacterium]|nr:hypothetical protein [Candidatus Peribacteraceae bacterium]